MKTLTVAEFKAQFGRLAKARIPILVRNRRVPIGVAAVGCQGAQGQAGPCVGRLRFDRALGPSGYRPTA